MIQILLNVIYQKVDYGVMTSQAEESVPQLIQVAIKLFITAETMIVEVFPLESYKLFLGLIVKMVQSGNTVVMLKGQSLFYLIHHLLRLYHSSSEPEIAFS